MMNIYGKFHQKPSAKYRNNRQAKWLAAAQTARPVVGEIQDK